jgi:hypothetical protein
MRRIALAWLSRAQRGLRYRFKHLANLVEGDAHCCSGERVRCRFRLGCSWAFVVRIAFMKIVSKTQN